MVYLSNFKLHKDIRFWIMAFFFIRLVGITNPPLEIAHNWRQTAVNTVARNFEEIDPNPLYPRFDTAGEFSGISGTEFPIFNLLIYWANALFGYTHWIGRLINLIVSSLGVYWFYLLLSRWFSKDIALYSSIILLASLWFAFSRKIMPDTFSLSLVIGALYCADVYLKKGQLLWLVSYLLLSGLGMLSKIPAASLMALLVVSLFQYGFYKQRLVILALTSALPLAVACWWYFYWFPHITTDYQLFSMGPGVLLGFKQLWLNKAEMIDNFYFDALKFSGFALFLFGVYKAFISRNQLLIAVLLSSMLAFSIFMLQAGYGFAMHEYYTLPFVPVMALLAGYGISMVKKPKAQWLLLTIILVEGIANQQHDFFIKASQRYKLDIEAFVNAHVPEKVPIVINGGMNPQLMYFAHRRGWSLSSKALMQDSALSDICSKGGCFLVWDKHQNEKPSIAYSAIAENDDLVIFDLKLRVAD